MSKDNLFLNHIISQTQANVSFLSAHSYLSPSDASDIMTRLATAQTAALSLGGGKVKGVVDPHDPHAVKAPKGEKVGEKGDKAGKPAKAGKKARALWAYNEHGANPDELSFAAGEIIDIVSEDNPSWWTGTCRGRHGSFPSNYVEKIATPPPAHSPPPPSHSPHGGHSVSPTPSSHGSFTAPPAWGAPPAGGHGVSMPGFSMPGAGMDAHGVGGFDAHGHGGYPPPAHDPHGGGYHSPPHDPHGGYQSGYPSPPHDPHGYQPTYAAPYGAPPGGHQSPSPYGDHGKPGKEGKIKDPHKVKKDKH